MNCKNCSHEIHMWLGKWRHNPITEAFTKPCMKGPNCGCTKPEMQNKQDYTESLR